MTGWKDWQIGEVVTESDFQSLVQDQVVQRYADASARTSALGTAVAEGMVSYLDDTNALTVYDGSSWIPVGEGDITSVTAGTGLTGGGTAGDVTLSADYAAIGSAITIETSQVSDLTATASELNILDGATVTASALNTIDDGTQGFTALSNGTAGISYQPVSPNYIINGAFDVWQRGTSFSNLALFQYHADRYLSVTNHTGGTVTWSQETFTSGAAPIAGYEGTYFLRNAGTSPTGGSFNVLSQKVEDVRTLAGQTATISFFAKADTTREISLSGVQRFGTGGSTEASFFIGAVNATTSWQRFSLTVTVPAVTGKTIGAGSHLGIDFFLPVNVSHTLDIWGVQLEAGSVATPFKRNAPSLQGELAACQRYYWRAGYNSAYGGQLYNYPFLGTGLSESTTAASVVLPLPVPMRIAPTSIEVLAASSYVLSDGPNNYTASAIGINVFGYTGYNSVNISVTTSGMTSARALFLRSNFGSNAYIGVSAEL